MFKKIAVVLRGHVRTWHYINQFLFKNYSNISDSVDYHFVTWYFPELDSDKIINSFRGQNLKKFVSVIPEKQYYNGRLGPSYLASQVLDSVMSENYDAIIDTRPDILPILTKKFNPEIKKKLVWAVWDKSAGGIDDTFQIMTKNTFEMYCRKHKLTNQYYKDWHVDLKNYYNLSNNIQTKGLGAVNGENIEGWDNWYIVRPNMLEHFPEDGDFLKHPSLAEELWKLWNFWDFLSLDEQQLLASNYNILPHDYEHTHTPAKKQ
jgi:hypothetical protein